MSPLPTRPSTAGLARRMARNAALVGGLVAIALLIGAAGYHYLDGLGWLDATLNAAMIVTGMGPVDRTTSPGAKLFAIGYALFGGVFFLTMVAVLLAPAVQHFLHRFHLELDENREAEEARQAAAASDAVCRLPITDRAQRTADFRELFADGSVERGRIPAGVRWTLPAGPATEADSRRLAALEARCCDGVRFAVERRGDQVVWEITGPASAAPLLDALYELPVVVATDDGARALWDSLDGAACSLRRG